MYAPSLVPSPAASPMRCSSRPAPAGVKLQTRNRPRALGVTSDVKTVAAFALIVLAACGSLPVSEISDSIVDTTTTTTTVAIPTVVPWVDRPAPPFVPPEEPVVSFPTDARPCRSSDLEVHAGPGGGGMGHGLSQFLFTNRSTTACVL